MRPFLTYIGRALFWALLLILLIMFWAWMFSCSTRYEDPSYERQVGFLVSIEPAYRGVDSHVAGWSAIYNVRGVESRIFYDCDSHLIPRIDTFLVRQ